MEWEHTKMCDWKPKIAWGNWFSPSTMRHVESNSRGQVLASPGICKLGLLGLLLRKGVKRNFGSSSGWILAWISKGSPKSQVLKDVSTTLGHQGQTDSSVCSRWGSLCKLRTDLWKGLGDEILGIVNCGLQLLQQTRPWSGKAE